MKPEPGHKHVHAHITGTVWKIVVQAGQTISEGDTVMILESMKMEMPVETEHGGTVTELLVQEGQPVDEGAPVAIIKLG